MYSAFTIIVMAAILAALLVIVGCITQVIEILVHRHRAKMQTRIKNDYK